MPSIEPALSPSAAIDDRDESNVIANLEPAVSLSPSEL